MHCQLLGWPTIRTLTLSYFLDVFFRLRSCLLNVAADHIPHRRHVPSCGTCSIRVIQQPSVFTWTLCRSSSHLCRFCSSTKMAATFSLHGDRSFLTQSTI